MSGKSSATLSIGLDFTLKKGVAVGLGIIGIAAVLVGSYFGFVHEQAVASLIIAGELYGAELTASELPWYFWLILFGGGGGFVGAMVLSIT